MGDFIGLFKKAVLNQGSKKDTAYIEQAGGRSETEPRRKDLDEASYSNDKNIFRSDWSRMADRKRLEECRDKIYEFLTLRENAKLSPAQRELSQSLKECFEAWRELPPLQAENDQAEIVLSAYYRQGKIQDLLKKLRAFVERMDAVDSGETARDLSYNNYIFFLSDCMTKMNAQYKAVQEQPPLEMPELTPENVAWFISTQCGHIPVLRDLPKGWDTARKVLDNDASDHLTSALAEVSEAAGYLDQDPTGSIAELQTLTGIFNERKENILRNINQGSKLYKALQVMTDDWFHTFDPEAEDSPVREMSQTELKVFYQERFSRLELPEEPFSV